MSDHEPRGIIDTGGGRQPFFRYVVRLYSSDAVFKGLVDFAVIGGVVLMFLHPPSLNWLRNLLTSKSEPATQQSAPVQPASNPSSPNATASQASKPADAPQPPAAHQGRAAQPQSSATPPSSPSAGASGTVAMPLLEDLRRPRLNFRFLFEIDEKPFFRSEPEDRPRLHKAAHAHREYRHADMLDALAGARSNDPNVAFLRGVGSLFTNRGPLAVEQLQAAMAGGQVQAGTLLGIIRVVPPSAVYKDADEGKRLIESAAAKGDRVAQRAAGIGYQTGAFGVADPFKAAAYFKSAVAAGDIAAMPHYAHMMFTGTGVDKEEAGAEELVERAAKAGLTLAQETLGSWILDRYKVGVISDPIEGVHWLEKACQQGYSISALVRLATFYGDEGRGQWRDRAKALEMYKIAATFAEPRAHFGHATGLQFGWTGEKDLVKAYTLYEVTRQMNNSSTAATRQKTIETMISPAEKDAALEAARVIRRDLKPVPRVILLLYPGQTNPPPPWTIPASETNQAAPAKP